MWAKVTDSGWVAEATVFLDHFKALPDPRPQAKVVYRLDELLLQSLLAVLAGAETFTDIARFGEKKLELLRRFLPFSNGTPTHDRIGEISAALDAEAFQSCFVDWVAALTRTPVAVIAIDGKTSRGSRGKGAAGLHLVSAFAARQRRVLAQAKVSDKSNAIVAIPALLDLLSIEGAVVTLDAMGCQRDIAAKIIAKRADYSLALKGNQGSLRADVELFASEQKARAFIDTAISTHETVDADHGRVETRRYTVFHDLGWLQARHDWPGLNAVIRVESERWTIARTERETRFYITSLTTRAEHCGPMVRDHWAIENALHWVMDMTFRDDECRVRTDQAPANFATRRHIAHNLVRRAPGKKWDCPSKSMVRSAGAGFSDHLSGNGFFQSLPHHFEDVPAASPALCGKAG